MRAFLIGRLVTGLSKAGRQGGREQNQKEAGSPLTTVLRILQTEKHLEGNYFHFHIALGTILLNTKLLF